MRAESDNILIDLIPTVHYIEYNIVGCKSWRKFEECTFLEESTLGFLKKNMIEALISLFHNDA